jgi:hypothetical protein
LHAEMLLLLYNSLIVGYNILFLQFFTLKLKSKEVSYVVGVQKR